MSRAMDDDESMDGVDRHSLDDVAFRSPDGPHRPQPLGQAALQFRVTRVRIESLAHIAHSRSTTVY